MTWSTIVAFLPNWLLNYTVTRTFLVVLNLACLEPMGLGDKSCCQRRWCCCATFLFWIQFNEVIGHNVNTKSVKIARRDRLHIWLSFTPVWNLWKPFTYWYCSSEEKYSLSGNLPCSTVCGPQWHHHNPRFIYNLFYSKFFLTDPGSLIHDPSFPVNLEVLLISLACVSSEIHSLRRVFRRF